MFTAVWLRNALTTGHYPVSMAEMFPTFRGNIMIETINEDIIEDVTNMLSRKVVGQTPSE
jgi:hypothetical protein